MSSTNTSLERRPFKPYTNELHHRTPFLNHQLSPLVPRLLLFSVRFSFLAAFSIILQGFWPAVYLQCLTLPTGQDTTHFTFNVRSFYTARIYERRHLSSTGATWRAFWRGPSFSPPPSWWRASPPVAPPDFRWRRESGLSSFWPRCISLRTGSQESCSFYCCWRASVDTERRWCAC